MRPASTIGSAKNETERALKILVVLVVAALAALMLFLLVAAPAFSTARSIITALLAALASAGLGALLGLLFGLPNVRDRAAKSNSWYIESTTLEQIADWLTKIIIGVTLVQFDALIGRITDISTAITADISCPVAQSCGPALGAGIIVTFFIFGLLISYLWVRRYMMKELEHARDDAELEMVADADKRGVLADRSNTVPAQDLQSILNAAFGVGVAKPGIKADDPWSGLFEDEVSAFTLSATVQPLNSMDLFDVVLTLTLEGDAAKNTKDGDLVTFVLHPSFPNSIQRVPLKAGRATLEFISWGSFTVLAQAAGARASLDLAEIPGVSAIFASR